MSSTSPSLGYRSDIRTTMHLVLDEVRRPSNPCSSPVPLFLILALQLPLRILIPLLILLLVLLPLLVIGVPRRLLKPLICC